ncbi:MAG: EAL domain-containing protein [Eubacterium sp.]|nr:EAL domain-containing protein [Eubacterium sp.]
MKRRKIALLVAQADEEYQSDFVHGALERAFAEDVDVYVFSMFIKYQSTRAREDGDSNIFSLVNYSEFDGVIVLSDMIQTPGVEPEIQEKIHACYSGPVVCVDTESKYFTTFWTDGYQAVYDTVSHMIEKHGMKEIAYLTGRQNHVHSIRRLEAYRAAMKDHGLEVNEDWVFYGDFWYYSGVACAESLLRDREHMPQAVVCANDPMAIGVGIGLENAGIKIPDDLAVVGYGTSEEGRKSPCPITSPWVPGGYYGAFAVETVLRELNGEKPILPEPETSFFIGESCGCTMAREESVIARRQIWETGNSVGGFQSLHDYLMEDLLLAENLEDFFRTVYDYVYFLEGVRRLDIYLDEQWLNPDRLARDLFLSEGYPERMLHVMSYDLDHSEQAAARTGKMIDTAVMLEDAESERPMAHFFVPIFNERKAFGYAVFDYGGEPTVFTTVTRFWMYAVSRGLEILRRTIVLKNYSQLLTPDKELNYPTFIDDRFQPKEEELTDEEQRERKEVQRILDKNLFTYHFQPIVSVKDGEIYSYEALMRSGSAWKVPPLQIIRHSSGLGRLQDVEKATFLNVLGLVETKSDEFKDRKIFVNSIPGIKLKREDQMRVDHLLREHAQQIVVELTEQAELEDETLENLKTHLMELGSGIAVDDYGTGYSNISNLLRYMPNVVKIDKSLLTEIQSSSQKQHFVRNIIEFCHDNNILALAEGVETREELQAVIRLGADLIQGFYLARPTAEIQQSIDTNMKMEICRFYREHLDGLADQVYRAGKTARVTINNLIKEAKTTILIGEKDSTCRDITIAGNPNVGSNIHIEILEGYSGAVTMENVILSNQKQRPCIRIAENANLTLRLVGENRLEGGGILVPESSSLTVEGDGNLKIELDGTEVFGIGNESGKTHGPLMFYQDGEIIIEASGKTMYGIGSGLGGRIEINKGKYTFSMSGSEGVGIGSMHGREELLIHDCDLYMDYAFREGVCIGSTYGSMQLEAMSSMFRFNCSGTRLAVIGTLAGEFADLKLHDLSMHINLRSDRTTAFGSLKGASRIDIVSAAIRYKGAGIEAWLFGGESESTTIHVDGVDMKARMDMKEGHVTNAPRKQVNITRSITDVIINDEEMELT